MMSCFCQGNKKKKQADSGGTSNARIQQKERDLLTLIFQNICSRDHHNKLTQQNFVIFLSLTGLWGNKLFKYFTSDDRDEINLHDFLEGMAKTVRAPFNDKITILFNFIKEQDYPGIRYKQFLKMLYHYSKAQLKQIMTNDGVFVHQAIIPSSKQLMQEAREGEVVHLEHTPDLTNSGSLSTFKKAYEDIMSNYRDPGTQFTFTTSKITYKVSYCNMNYLTKQYASHIFMKFKINEETGSMNEAMFKEYIENNMALFETYYATFHEDLWGVKNDIPNFIAHIEMEGLVYLIEGKVRQSAYMMLSGNAIFLSISEIQKEEVFKIIILDSVALDVVDSKCIIIKDVPNANSITKIQCESEQKALEWREVLKDYEKNYIHTKYEIIEPIGTGRFSVVYRCKQRSTNKIYALKVMELSKLEGKPKSSIQNETKIVKILKSPNIIKFYETIFTKTSIYMVSELVYGEDLFEYVKRKKRLDEYEAAFLLGQLIEAVMDLHNMEIIHRDLKPENIMVTYRKLSSDSDDREMLSPTKIKIPKPEIIKIIDFGFADYLSVLTERPNSSPVGTPNYIAPQILLGEKPSFQNDTFAIGSILFFMLRGKYAFDSSEPAGTALRTVQGDYSLHDDVWEEISDQAKDLIEMLLQTDPAHRITLKQALNHSWFSYVKPSNNLTVPLQADHKSC